MLRSAIRFVWRSIFQRMGAAYNHYAALKARYLVPPHDPVGDISPYLTNEDAGAYRARLIREIIEEFPGTGEAYALIQEALKALADPADRAHAPLHEVRYLMTYALAPRGPGRLVDIAASPIYAAPLKSLKTWTIEAIPILAFDYEKERLPFPDASVDGVLICEVIEHFVLDPLHCLIEINRILKSNGFVLLTTPNIASWFAVYQSLHQCHPSRWPVYAWNAPNSANHIHAREYTPSEVSKLLENAGFGNISLTTRDYGISPPHRPVPGFSTKDRGETIFCLGYKKSPPIMRSFSPLYLTDVAFSDLESSA